MIEKKTLNGSELWRFRLDENNPRHEPKTQQQDIIDYLAANEDVLPMLEDIAGLKSLNPLDRLGVLRDGELYVALEGNRRLCSLILLNDPELAPAKYREKIRVSAAGWDPSSVEIDIAIFDQREDADPWLERRHQGALNGKGQKAWSPAAKARHFKKSPNDLAIRLLDDGLTLNLITATERRKRVVTTVRRFSDNNSFRGLFLGITTAKDDPNYVTDLAADVYSVRLNAFFRGLFTVKPTVTSRMNASEIDEWVSDQLTNPDLSDGQAPGTRDASSSSTESAGGNNAPHDQNGAGGGSAAGSTGGNTESKPTGSAGGAGAKPQSPASRWYLVDGNTFTFGTGDPVRRQVIYELTRVGKSTPIAASGLARIFLEGIYVDLWQKTCSGKSDSKLHVKVLAIVEVIKTWDLTRTERNALDALHRSASNPGHLLSPAGLGAAAHGAAVPAWATLVSEWDTLLPIARRIFAFVEGLAGQERR